MGFYKVIDNVSPRFASDVNQYADALSGNADVGKIVLYTPISAPGALTAAISSTAGVLTGAYQYVVCFLTGYWQGEQQTGTLIVQGNTGYGAVSAAVSPSGQQVNLSSIPIGPTGVVARLIGRTKAGGSTFYSLVQINDNTTTSWTDNTPDNGLGSTALTQANTTGTYLVPTTIASLTANIPAAGTIGIYNGQWYYSNGTAWVAMAPPLQPATASVLGGVMIGQGVNVTSNGTISVNVFQHLAYWL